MSQKKVKIKVSDYHYNRLVQKGRQVNADPQTLVEILIDSYLNNIDEGIIDYLKDAPEEDEEIG